MEITGEAKYFRPSWERKGTKTFVWLEEHDVFLLLFPIILHKLLLHACVELFSIFQWLEIFVSTF